MISTLLFFYKIQYLSLYMCVCVWVYLKKIYNIKIKIYSNFIYSQTAYNIAKIFKSIKSFFFYIPSI